jgi:hypothetical protein
MSACFKIKKASEATLSDHFSFLIIHHSLKKAPFGACRLET